MGSINKNLAVTRMQILLCAIVVIVPIAVSTYYLAFVFRSPVPFSLEVISRPASFGNIVYSIPGQKCIFLIVVKDEGQSNGGAKSVDLSVSSSDCEVTVFPKAITSGQVAELTVIPTEANIGRNVTVVLQGKRDGLKHQETITTEVIEGEDTLQPEAAAKRDLFVNWLSANYPELNITSETAWIGTIVNPRILVVMHYLFLSEEREMYVTWHVMIPPYDWTKIYIRNRFSETSPSYAFEISSIEEESQPQSIEIPDWV